MIAKSDVKMSDVLKLRICVFYMEVACTAMFENGRFSELNCNQITELNEIFNQLEQTDRHNLSDTMKNSVDSFYHDFGRFRTN